LLAELPINVMNNTSANQGVVAETYTNAPFTGLITRDKEPENLEFPFSALSSWIVPNEQMFVRSHFPVPKVDMQTWRLEVEGLVKKPIALTFDELRQMPSRSVTMVMECAGNSRIFLNPKVSGLQWELGAVGNAEWTGVPLSEVLKRAGVKDGAVEVVLEGMDRGEIKKEPVSPGKISYARSIPLTKAMSDEVILAYQMNGEELTPSHGFPLRAVVPGHYGMASVKWVNRIILLDREFRGYFQTTDYTYWDKQDGMPIQLLPVSEIEVKAEISRPALHEAVPANSVYRVFGAAWTGESEVVKLEVSTDGGKNWQAGQLLGDSVKYAWRLWEYHWSTPPQPGRYTVMARATDAHGNTQPMERDMHRGTYVITHVQPIDVQVRKVNGASSEDSYAI
jgi:DMSO/TMAO reductase YedYZ molybdopterin-dependent catalytic subunit